MIYTPSVWYNIGKLIDRIKLNTSLRFTSCYKQCFVWKDNRLEYFGNTIFLWLLDHEISLYRISFWWTFTLASSSVIKVSLASCVILIHMSCCWNLIMFYTVSVCGHFKVAAHILGRKGEAVAILKPGCIKHDFQLVAFPDEIR